AEFSPMLPTKKRGMKDLEEDKRRRTWHPDSFAGFRPPPDDVDMSTPSWMNNQTLQPQQQQLPSLSAILRGTPSPSSAFSSPAHSNRSSWAFPQSPMQHPIMEPSVGRNENNFNNRRDSFSNSLDRPNHLHEFRRSSIVDNSPKRRSSPPPPLKLESRHSWAPSHGQGYTSFANQTPVTATPNYQMNVEKRYDDGPTPTKEDTFAKAHRTATNGRASNRSSYHAGMDGRYQREGSSEESETGEAVVTPASSVDLDQQKYPLKQQ